MRKIGVITGTRAEYGLLKPLISAVGSDPDFELQILVTGMHLMPEFGNTYRQIEEDGFTITAKIEDGLTGDSTTSIVKSMGKAMIGFAQTYKNLQPDLIIVLGDRTEILAAAIAAMIATIPIAHIHGGETTEGAYDEFIRHSITKMSHLHFAATEVYRQRIIQLGEHPSRVINVGAIAIDSVKALKLMNKITFEASISKKLDKHSVLITFHPVTLEKATASIHFKVLLEVLDTLQNTTLIFTKPNSDKDGRIIMRMIDSYVSQNKEKAVSFHSLGQLRYLSALRYVDFVIGNSSSGILEVPYFKIPTVNIGDRQKGRIIPASVINSEPTINSIKDAIHLALNPLFLAKIQNQKNLYGDGKATPKIIEELKEFDYSKVKKSFYDLKDECFEEL